MHPRLYPRLRFTLLLGGALAVVAPARAQNDWQFPDPYFGVIEFGKSRVPGSTSRSHAQIEAAPRPAVKPRPARRGYRGERMRRAVR